MSGIDNYLHKKPTLDQFATEKVNVINCGLLGDYVGDKYEISSYVTEELLAMPKYKKTTFKNSVFLSAYLPTQGEVVFEIVYEKNSVNNTAMATIYVLENEYKVNGYLQNTLKTKLSVYVDDLDGFIEKSYVKFNVLNDKLGDGKNYKVQADPNLQGYISAKKQFTGLLKQLTQDQYLKIYKSYFEQKLKLIKGLNNDFSNNLLDKFNAEYAKIEKYFLQNKDYKSLSELLDKCFEDVYGLNPNLKDQEKEYREKILPLIIQFSNSAETLIENAKPKAITKLKKDDKEKVEKIQQEVKAKQQVKSAEKQKSAEVPVAKPKAVEKPKASEKADTSKSIESVFKDLKSIRKELSQTKESFSNDKIVATEKLVLNEKQDVIKDGGSAKDIIEHLQTIKAQEQEKADVKPAMNKQQPKQAMPTPEKDNKQNDPFAALNEKFGRESRGGDEFELLNGRF